MLSDWRQGTSSRVTEGPLLVRVTPEASLPGCGAYWCPGNMQTEQAREARGLASFNIGTAGCGTARPVV